jgi:hypothetical protein
MNFLHFHPKQALFGLAVVLAAFQKKIGRFFPKSGRPG